MEKVGKGRTVPVGARVRVFWPLDDAWYGGKVVGHETKESVNKQGELKVTKLHTVLYHDGVREDLNFDKEKVQVVSVGAGDGIPPVDGNPPCRVPIVGGTQPGWILPNARRGAERVAVCGEGGVVVREMSLLDFHDEYVVSAAAPAAGDDANGKVAGNVEKRWRRTLSFDPARCGERLRRRGGCAKAVSIGRWLANQGAAWGEAAVGRPVKVRPSGWAYGERDCTRRRSGRTLRGVRTEVAGSNPAEAACVGEKRKEPRTRTRRTSDPPSSVSDEWTKSTYTRTSRSSSQPEKDEEAAAGDGETAAVEPADDDGLGPGDSPGGDSPGGDSPDDDADDETEWRAASIVGFNAQTGDHQMLYSDGTREWLPLILHETKAASDGKKYRR